jgi:protein phosphatase
VDRIAVISDLHGNLPALEATLNDIRQRDITRIFCLGDLIGKGPDSAKAVDICRDVCEATVRGNWDEWISRASESPIALWHQERLAAARLEYLATLPNTIELTMSGRRIRLFHASHQGIFHRVRMYDGREAHLEMFTNTEFTGDAFTPDIVGYGDVHTTFLKSFQHRTLFNVGSVGNPLDLPLASYAILEGVTGSARAAPFSVNLIRVPYDIERAIHDARAAQMPDLEAYIDELRTARYRWLPKPA